LHVSGSVQPTHTVLKFVCGDKLFIHGKTELDLQTGNKIFRNIFVIADKKFPNQMYHAILGLNIMTKFDVCLQIKRRIIKTNLGKNHLSSPREKHDKARVTLNNTVIVPAQSEMFLIGTIDRKLAEEDFILEPSDYIRHRGLLVARSVVKPEAENNTVC
jgi:hypothetical protein